MSRPKKAKKKAGKSKYWQPPGRAEAVKTAEVAGTVTFTPDDKVLLEKQETIIAANIGAFLLLGEALNLIKERNLQKITDPQLSFDEYCSKKWGFGKAYAYRLIAGYKCVQHLTKTLTPTGVTIFPTNEAQVRPMTKLSPVDQVKTWSLALKKAGGGIVTAALVENVATGKAATPARSYRITPDKAAVRAEHKKLETIAKLVDQGLGVNPTERSIKQLSEILEQIQKLLNGKNS